MKFTVCGGDLRSVYLARRLMEDGHTVQCFDLDTADLPTHCHKPTLHSAVRNTQCVILPTPVFKGGMLNAPFGSSVVTSEELAQTLFRNVPVFGGSIPEDFHRQCAHRGVYPIDLLSMEALAVKNASLTAECAVQVILQELPCTVANKSVLILGAGRIGKLLGLKLKALGAAVTVSARQEADKAWCAALGLIPADTGALVPLLPHCQLLINTIPTQVLSAEQLGLLPKDARLFELASTPGGFSSLQDTYPVIHCGGLPGKYAPLSAADAIAETIYQILER